MILLAGKVFAAEADSLIYFNNLNFINSKEHQFFSEISTKKDVSNILQLLLIAYQKGEIYDATLAEKKINDCVLILKEKTKDKTEAKKIKLIHQYVHETFFKVYKLNNSFASVFETGEYNCVSGTALFAIILSKLAIPYQIIEAPSHVFLIAYPGTEKIVVESTVPGKGSFQFSNSIIEKYIVDLYKSKLISKEEFESSTASKLFEKYYFASGEISLLELAGIQFSNYALYATDEKREEEALEYIKKSYYLQPCERSKHLFKFLLFSSLNKGTYKTQKDIDKLILLCRLHQKKDSDVTTEVVKNEFNSMLNTQLTENSALEQCRVFHALITKEIKDSVLKKETDFAYYYEVSRIGLINGIDSKTELKNLELAYANKPNNANLQAFILEHFGNTIHKMNDVDKIIELIAYYEQHFNFLQKNFLFNTTKANVYLELAYQNFTLGAIKKGDEYISLCEKMKQQSAVEPDAEFVEKAYAEAASYFFKKGNYAKAKSYLQNGLLMAPNSFGLNQRLRSIP